MNGNKKTTKWETPQHCKNKKRQNRKNCNESGETNKSYTIEKKLQHGKNDKMENAAK